MSDRWTTRLLGDFAIAGRQLFRAPRYAITAIAALCLGLAAPIAVFSMVDALMLHPFAFRDPERLVVLREFSPQQCPRCSRVSPDHLTFLRNHVTTLAAMAAISPWNPVLRGVERSDVVQGYRVSPSIFAMLGIRPVVGRTLVQGDEQPNSAAVVVLSHRIWTARFGSDSSVVGRSIVLDGQPYHVAGVLPPDVAFPPEADVWTAREVDVAGAPGSTDKTLQLFARVRDGATATLVEAELLQLSQSLRVMEPKTMEGGWRFGALPIRDWRGGDTGSVLILLVGLAACFLALTAANFAALTLTRGLGRRTELALRAAIGASRSRLLLQLVLESAVLSIAAGVLGFLLATISLLALKATIPEALTRDVPGWTRLGVHPVAALFAAVVAVATGVLASVAPSLRLSRPGAVAALRSAATVDDRLGAGGVLRRFFVAGQIAIALALMLVSGLLVRSVSALSTVDFGFRSRQVLTARLRLPESGSGAHSPPFEMLSRVLERIESLPGIEAVGAVSSLPLEGGMAGNFAIDGNTDSRQLRTARLSVISAGYFSALGIPLLAGRQFSVSDNAGGPLVVIINRRIANQYASVGGAVGQTIRVGDAQYEIIGVVGDVYTNDIDRGAGGEIYRPYTQIPQTSMTIAVRTSDEPAMFTRTIARTIADVSPSIGVADFRTGQEVVAEFAAPQHILAQLVGGLGALAILIAGLGLYGAISYSVAQRTRELGLRLALGASPGLVAKLVGRDAASAALPGLVVGLLLGAGLARLMGSLLFGVTPTDPVTFCAILALLTAVIVAAAFAPARRAMHVQPSQALRDS